ncbi:MAG: 1-deoxy-D-xylulose-5-phosphate synthase [Victivallaceae bacterium]|nr:1-deoxy-D-xylulose-5-phosphate synthase [Victivallaceae bacterium]
MIAIPEKADLKRCDVAQLEKLCADMRQEIIQTVAANGGHLSSSLGCVELITALHYVFDIPAEPLIFDVGHQALAHKLLTGRAGKFATLRQAGGISGFPCPAESGADTGISGHAGVAISQAIGLADGRAANATPGKVIALLGDGAMTCGISWEGLNSAAGRKNLVIILNDNNMAIAKNVGALARYLNHIISGARYNQLKEKVRIFLQTHKTLYRAASKIDDFLKSALMPPSTIFQELGIRYIGPVHGHDLAELIPIFRQVRDNIHAPVLIHVVTTKGKGCDFAERSPEIYHGISGCDPVTGAMKKSSATNFSKAFGEKLTELGKTHPELEAISASMLDGTGLTPFQKAYPERCHDVGIEEEHAVAYAAGLAMAHRRVVVALYSTFAQRALDNIYHDVALAKLPVIFALDRAGIVADGPTHHGIYDLGFLREMPDMEILSPATELELKAMLDYLMTVKLPAVIRYPRGSSHCDRVPSPIVRGRAELLREGKDLVIWALGTMTQTALESAEILAASGIQSTVINTRFIKPFDDELAKRFAATPMLTLEDHHTSGGLGAALEESLGGIVHAPVLRCGWSENAPIPHGDTDAVKKQYQLDAASVAARAKTFLTTIPE